MATINSSPTYPTTSTESTSNAFKQIPTFFGNHPAALAGICVGTVIILVLIIIASYYCCCRHDACCCPSRTRRDSYDSRDLGDLESRRSPERRRRGRGHGRHTRSMAEMGREMGVSDMRGSTNRSGGGSGNTSQESVMLQMRGGSGGSDAGRNILPSFGHIEDAPPAYEAGPSAPPNSGSTSRPPMPITMIPNSSRMMSEEEEDLALSIPYSRREPGQGRVTSEEEDLDLSIPYSRREPGLSRVTTIEEQDISLSIPFSQRGEPGPSRLMSGEEDDLTHSIPFSRREPGSDSTAMVAGGIGK